MKTYSKVMSYIGRMKIFIILGILCSSISAFITLFGYYNINTFFHNLVVSHNGSNVVYFAKVIFICFMLGFLVYFVSVFFTHLAAFRLETALRKKGIEGLEGAGFSFFDNYPSGQIRKIIDDNAAQTHMAVAHLIPDLASGIITPIGLIVLGYLIDLKVGIILTVVTVLSIVLMFLMMGDTKFLKEYQKFNDRLSAETVEYVRGIQVVKIFGGRIESFKNFYGTITAYSELALKYALSCKWPYTVFQLVFFALMTVVIPIWIMMKNFGENPEETTVQLIMVLLLSGVFFVSYMKLMYMGMHIQIADMSIGKLEDLYDEMEKSQNKFGTKTEFEGFDIEFNQVDFAYKDKKVLEDFNIKLKEGGIYAFVGSSGSGKSTVAKLVAGFYPVNAGTVKIGGIDINEYSEDAVMKNIAFVFQDPELFKKSIYENVRIGNPEATRQEVMEAISLAGCNDIIEKFPDKEDTVIGSKGVYLSGGEKQRITIARAILKDAGIIILDEASGAVDPENEYEFQRAFSNLIQGKTVIMIAHRLSSIKGVDRIFVMDGGRIIEHGSHSELMDGNTRYSRFQNLYEETNDWRLNNG